MKRRFGRRRRSGGDDDGRKPIDAGWLARLTEAGLVPVETLETITDDNVPSSLALLGEGADESGAKVLVVFSPQDAGDALLALAAHRSAPAPAAAPETDGDAAEPEAPAETPEAKPAVAYVVSRWSAAARRRLALIGELDVKVGPIEAGRLLEGPGVAPEAAPAPKALPPEQVGAGLSDPTARELFSRALAGLSGLAAKHAGGVRGTEAGVELVLVARRVARLSTRDDQVQLETFGARTGPQRLTAEGLADALDGLEGQLRKRLRDGTVTRSEDGLRAGVAPNLAAACGLRSVVAFPLGGSDGEVLDAVGVGEDGAVVVVAVRKALDVAALGPILDAWAALQPSVPGLLTSALPPVRLDRAPRLVVAAETMTPGAVRVLEGLTLETVRLDVRGTQLVPAGSAPASAPAVGEGRERAGRRRGRGRRGPRRTRGERGEEDEGEDAGAEASAEEGEEAEAPARAGRGRREGRGRGRGRGGRGRNAEASENGDIPDGPAALELDASDDSGDDGGEDAGEDRPRFAELSSFDLDDSFGLGEGESAGRKRRGRSRRRGGRGRRQEEGEEEDGEGPPGRDRPSLADADPSDEESPEVEDQDEDVTVDEEDLALAEAPEPEEEPEPLRQDRPRRAAVLAHADRHSIAAAMLLAREARQVEGVWIYPQEELMTFFRSVATDLRDDTTIFVVGFQASPARDALQAAALYAGRIEWYDTQAWPPEDLAQLKEALGSDFVDVRENLESCVPLVLPRCSRRSRFSDKLVDLAAGRFTEHDFQRWGRLWWWRLGDLAARPGEHRNELQALLTGRPSELAQEADRAEMPPPPPEVEFVGSRDFRIVHFGGYAMVIIDVPAEFDLSLTGRVVRERYGAHLSLARREGDGLLILGTHEGLTPRPMAVVPMAQHLGQKLAWVDALAADDHVARVFVHGLDAHPERLDALIAEIGMGRTILEG